MSQNDQTTAAERETAYDAELAHRPELLRYAARLHHEPGVVELPTAELTDAELETLAREVEALHYRVPVASRQLWQLTRLLHQGLRAEQIARDTAWRTLARSAGPMPAWDDEEER
jgi:hypothetical protein